MAEFSTASSRYRIRDAQEDDVPSIARLYAGVEPSDPITADEYGRMWRWLHLRNPPARRKVLVGIDPSGEVVGHVGLVPFAFRTATAKVVEGFPCQLMVAEHLRHSLLYPQLVKRLLREYASAGFDGAYALIVRPRVLQANIALGFRQLGVVPVHARPYRISRALVGRLPNERLAGPAWAAGTLAERILRVRIPWRTRGLLVEPVRRFDRTFDQLLDAAQAGWLYRATRSAEILNWRFIEAPDRAYRVLAVWAGGEPVGYVALRRMTMQGFDVLAVVDLLVHPRHQANAARALLAAVHELALNMRVELSACLMSPHDPLRRRLLESGFLPTPQRFALVIHQPNGQEQAVDPTVFPRWRVTWFDHDFV